MATIPRSQLGPRQYGEKDPRLWLAMQITLGALKCSASRGPAIPSSRNTLAFAYRRFGLDGPRKGLAVRETVSLCVGNATFIRLSTANQKHAYGSDDQVHGFQYGLRSPRRTADVLLGCARPQRPHNAALCAGMTALSPNQAGGQVSSLRVAAGPTPLSARWLATNEPVSDQKVSLSGRDQH